MTVSLSVFLSLAAFLPNCSWRLPAKSASASRVSKMKGLESTEETPEGLDFCPGAHTHTWDRAVLALHMGLCPAALECECVYSPVCSEVLQYMNSDPLRAPCSLSHWLKLSFLYNNHISQGTGGDAFLSSRMFCKDCQLESVSWIINQDLFS